MQISVKKTYTLDESEVSELFLSFHRERDRITAVYEDTAQDKETNRAFFRGEIFALSNVLEQLAIFFQLEGVYAQEEENINSSG